MNEFAIGLASNVGMMSFIALSAYLLLLAGEMSFGQQAFFGIGAYASAIATAMWGWPLAIALAWATLAAALGAGLLALPTLRLRGLHFAIATLAFAEMVRLAFELLRYQVEVDGEWIGPDGAQGFGKIRYIFEHDIEPFGFMLLIYALLAVLLASFFVVERSRLGAAIRMIGEDAELAAHVGVRVTSAKIAIAAVAGAIAGLGGGLYAHLTTYIEPRLFDVMLGVHALAYGLIGGLGTALGPIAGVVIDVGLLETSRIFAGYRMIVFGGLVALLLIWRPRGILDEHVVHRLGKLWRRMAGTVLSSGAAGPR